MVRGLALIALACLGVLASTSLADLRTPAWWDQNGVSVAPDWHYRVPISIPAGTAVNATIRVDVDFAALLNQLGANGTFDPNSPRVVRSNGSLAQIQEFTDTHYANATDPVGNARGEVRFILQDAGPVTYYLYFDISANGAKGANPQTPINGSFENGAVGTLSPVGWTATRTNASFDAQIRPSENPVVSSNGSTASPNPVTTDGTPFRGAQSYLLGARSNNESSTGANPRVTLTKTFVMPASCSVGLSLRYRPEGWDSSWGNGTLYDFIRVRLVSGATSVVLVGPDAPGADGNYASLPYSPNFSSDPPPPVNTGAADSNDSGFGPYNGFDTNNSGGRELGMTVARGAQPWFTPTHTLAGFAAGATVTLEITTTHATLYRSWHHIDNVEWCVTNGTLGTAEGFGVNVTAPTGSTVYNGGQRLVVRAQVDASATAPATPVTANVYDEGGTLVASNIRLFNDGTHGDAVAGDAFWTNDGSVGADPTYTFIAGVASGSNWSVRVFALDASTSSIGATNGLLHRFGQPTMPLTPANFHNIDDQTFTVEVPWLTHLKTVQVSEDPYNGTTNPKSIPGATQIYTVRITNQGAASADANTLAIVDAIPASTCMSVLDAGPVGSGPVLFSDGTPSSTLTYTFTALGSGADDLDFSNNGGASWSYAPTPNPQGCDPAITHVRVRPQGAMAGGAGNPYFEIRFRVRVN